MAANKHAPGIYRRIACRYYRNIPINRVIGIKLLSEQIAEPLATTGKGRQNVPIKICSYAEGMHIQEFQIRKKFL